ncbi:MAG: ABC transporter permease [Candidatus Omnitrophica bacterium]|nr:ABC transporter permease [Candidatus Omnitrophota bacterium]
MPLLFTIAWRNITRNKYRSFITISAIAIGFASLLFVRAFVDGSHYQMIENYTDLASGHIQIHKKGFHANMSLVKNLAQDNSLSETLKNTTGVITTSSRIKESVLLSSTEGSTGALLIGVDPQNEPKVTKLNTRIKTGKFLTNDNEIVIGKSLAAILKAQLNDKIVIMGQGFDGSLASGVYRISGFLDTGADEIDKGFALITLKAAQELFVMDGRISEIALRLNNVEKAKEIANTIKTNLNNNELEVLPWQEISPIVIQWVEFDVAFINIILLIVLLVVAAGILNTLLMGILERTREFGIMLALGTKPNLIMQMVGLESLLLGLIGVATGYFIGIISIIYFGSRGIDLSMFSTALNSYYTGSIIYTRLAPGFLLQYGATVLITSIIVSIYPAYRAANLKPVEAIYHI